MYRASGQRGVDVVDAQRVLEQAAEERLGCELIAKGGSWRSGRVLRVERGGVILLAPGHQLNAGVDVRCWLRVGRDTFTFDASVLRVGVPVPDRSQDGLLLGFIENWKRSTPVQSTVILDILPPTGGPVSLVNGEARVVDLSLQEWTITAPTSFRLVLAEGSRVRLRLGLTDRAPLDVLARVGSLSRAHDHLLYGLKIEQVEDTLRYQELLEEAIARLDRA